LNKTGPQSIHILRGVRQQQDEPGRFSICSRQAAVVHIEVFFSRFISNFVIEFRLLLINSLQIMKAKV
ncbi:hypothetical protein ACVFAC_004614, partial [Shigella flexneri]